MLAQGILHLVGIIAAGKGALLPVLIDAAGHVLDGLDQIRRADGLEQVMIHAESNGPLGIFKITVAADDGHLQPGHHVLHMVDQLKPVQEGHADVRQHDIRHEVLHHRQRQLAVRRLAAEGIRACHALDHLADALTDQQLVLHDKNLVHFLTP